MSLVAPVMRRILFLTIAIVAFFVSPQNSLASTVDIDTMSQPASLPGTFQSTYWFHIPSGVVSGDILNSITLSNQYSNKDFQIFMYAVGNTSNVLATSTYVSHASAFSTVYDFEFPTTTTDCRGGCDFKVVGSNSSWWFQNTATQTITAISPNSGEKPRIKIVSTLTPVASSTITAPIISGNYRVASTTCTGTSTTSTCYYNYATTSTSIYFENESQNIYSLIHLWISIFFGITFLGVLQFRKQGI